VIVDNPISGFSYTEFCLGFIETSLPKYSCRRTGFAGREGIDRAVRKKRKRKRKRNRERRQIKWRGRKYAAQSDEDLIRRGVASDMEQQ